MKRYVFFVLILLFFVLNVNSQKFIIGINGGMLNTRDDRFKEIYSEKLFITSIQLRFKFYGDYYVWNSYGYSVSHGKTLPKLKLDTKIEQYFIMVGIGFSEKLFNGIGYKIELAPILNHYIESVFDIKSKGSGIGFFVDGGLTYDFTKRIFLEFIISYSGGYHKQPEVLLKMGGIGFNTGIYFRI